MFIVKIDLEDVDRCKQFLWCVGKTYHLENDIYYIRTNTKCKCLLLHKYLTETSGRLNIVDHIDGDMMNNRRSNLRIGTMQTNNMNRTHKNESSVSGYRGIYYDYRSDPPKWVSHIKDNGKRLHLGRFDTFEEALFCRKVAEEKYFGKFARDSDKT